MRTDTPSLALFGLFGLGLIGGCGDSFAPSEGDPAANSPTNNTSADMLGTPSSDAPSPSPDPGDGDVQPGQNPNAGPAPTGGAGSAPNPMMPGPAPTGPGEDSLPFGIVPLFDAATQLEPAIHFDRGDAIVTRFADRGRDRHAREDEFQSYDHYLAHYWEHRTARYEFVDTVAKGGSTIDVTFVTEWELDDPPEFRAWYLGVGTVANYSGNYGAQISKEGPGLYDDDLQRIGDGVQFKYTYTINSSFTLDGEIVPLSVGQYMEFEPSQFLNNPPVGRDNYYGTTHLYEVGVGGLLPWKAVGAFTDQSSERENSHPIDDSGWLGGRTTLHYQYSDEPDNHFMQMATNLAPVNGQPFVLGRRVHHTNMEDGSHDESPNNGTFDELQNLVGPRHINLSCDSCHRRNGRAEVASIGQELDQWVFKVAGADGSPLPNVGRVLQPRTPGGTTSQEGGVSIASWQETNGLRTPVYAFSGAQPPLFSARIAPKLVGLGLLEALDEATILEFEDAADADGDGISGKAQLSTDPITGQVRLGRFGWKAGASSLTHQIAGALNTDMGVMTSVLPEPDCGEAQADCEPGPLLSDEHLDNLVKYVALLGVRAQRDLDNPSVQRGQELFEQVGCGDCHRSSMTTSKYHPHAELRDQLIHPYSDLLLHDMGPGLADNLGEGEATGAEWRTTPLWGIGLSACVTGGVEGPSQDQTCTPHESYLHDGRARTLQEAILWHGGEGQASRDEFSALSSDDQAALLAFLRSL